MASILPTRRLVVALSHHARASALCRQQPRCTRTFFGFGRSGDSSGGASSPPSSSSGTPASGGGGEEGGRGAGGDDAAAGGAGNGASGNGSDAKQEDANLDTSSSLVPVVSGQGGLRKDGGFPWEPSLLVLPLERRPLFPGQQQLVQVTNQATVKDMMKLLEKGTPPFVGAFLRRSEVSEGDVPSESSPAAVGASAVEEDLSNVDPEEELYHIGTRARIVQMLPLMGNVGNAGYNGADQKDKGVQMVLHGHDLIRLDKVLDRGPPLQVQVSKLKHKKEDQDQDADAVKAHINETMHTVREIMKINPQFREHAAMIHQGLERMNRDDGHAIAHFAASLTTSSGPELMQVIEAEHPVEKLNLALTLVKKELALSQVQHKIATEIDEKVNSKQREYMLREQLRLIKKELGEDKSDGTDKLLRQFADRLEDKLVPKEAKEAIDAEISKFSNLAKESQEYQMTRNYLDWLTNMPWGVHSQDTLSLQGARAILDRDHYGLSDVKERILELIAVGALRGNVQGKILCVVGPPGVGKTSIGRSIAEALGREFYRFSVGGLYDVAEIKGHRRTYVGAMPGKIIQCLKKTQTANPLVLIDEVDKIGRGHQGDPASALLELLDPSQNGSFLDHYLDVPVDCSRVLFVCTANVTDTIPGPLLDRMEVIRLSGYDLQEKLRIAQDYLVPHSMKEVGLQAEANADGEKPGAEANSATAEGESQSTKALAATPKTAAGAQPEVTPEATPEATTTSKENSDVVAMPAAIEQDALESLIRWYCREAGVRNLQKHIEKICRKLATKVVERREQAPQDGTSAQEVGEAALDLRVTAAGLSEYVGKPPFTSDRLYEGKLPPGTVTGLAWTAMGGAVLYAEAAAFPKASGGKGTPNLSVTGQLGSVMKESSQIALLVARRQAQAQNLSECTSFFEEHELHLHCPEGATPKDGPSAGVTIVTAMLSLGLDRRVKADLAMTGEVSLNGKVLAVGGIKEKTIAARRAGCKSLVFPQANRRDFDELPEYLREGLDVHFASDYEDVFAVAFGEAAAPSAPSP